MVAWVGCSAQYAVMASVAIPANCSAVMAATLSGDEPRPQPVQVDNVRFRSIQGPDGSWVGTYLLVVEPAGGGDPWNIEYVAGTEVSRVL